jgi:outer membrane protein TolC
MVGHVTLRTQEARRATRRWACALGLFLLAGCATAGVNNVTPSPDSDPFTRGLMRYVRGELAEAERELVAAVTGSSHDLSALDLLQAIRRERGLAQRLALAEPALSVPELLSPEELIRIVQTRNPEIRKAVFQVIEARAQLREANVSFTPEFSLLTRFHPMGFLGALSQSVLGGYWQQQALKHQAEATVLEAVANYAKVRTDVLGRVLTAYFDLLEAQDLIQPLEQELRAREEQAQVAITLAQYGLLLLQDTLHFKRETANLQKRYADTLQRLSTAKATLNSLMGRSPEEPRVFVRKAVLVAEAPAEAHHAVLTARDRRQEVTDARAKVGAARARREFAAHEIPSVDLRAGYGQTVKAGRGDFVEGLSVGARITTPVLIWPLQRARLDRQDAFIRQLEMEVARLISTVELETITAYEELMAAQVSLRAAQQNVEATDEALRVSRAAQQAGAGGGRIQLLSAHVDHAQALSLAVAGHYAVQRASLKLLLASGALPEKISFAQMPGLVDATRLKAPNSARPGRALWVWRPTFLGNPSDMSFFVEFAKARRVESIFLFASASHLAEEPAPYRDFLKLTHTRGLTVHALNGEPTWIFPDHRAGLERFVAAILEFNRKSPPDARFDAVHLDVEPHTLPEWKAGKEQELARRYVELLRLTRESIRREGLLLAVDIPDKFDRIALGLSPLLDAVLDQADQIAVMAYKDQAQRIIEATRSEVEHTERKGKPLWIGISADPAHIRSSSQGRPLETELEDMIAQIQAAFSGRQSLLGVAIHDYDRYRRLILSPTQTPRAITKDPDASRVK